MNTKTQNLLCPICGEPLAFGDTEAVCRNNHHFDLAKQGYVNLLIRGGPGGTRHGDDSLMVKARRAFLEKGYYDPLAELIAETAKAHAPKGACLLDIGCGEGYYTEKLFHALEEPEILCIDISKEAVKRASKRGFPKTAAVASAFELPVKSRSCDIVLSIFAPYSEKEVSRILKDNGVLILALPRERHLFRLKAEIYDEPYANPPVKEMLDGFELLAVYPLDYELKLDNPEDIENLFKMTPYYYKTSAADQEKALALKTLRTEISFAVMVYRKS